MFDQSNPFDNGQSFKHVEDIERGSKRSVESVKSNRIASNRSAILLFCECTSMRVCVYDCFSVVRVACGEYASSWEQLGEEWSREREKEREREREEKGKRKSVDGVKGSVATFFFLVSS